jgi:ribosomal protein L37AE/L43A
MIVSVSVVGNKHSSRLRRECSMSESKSTEVENHRCPWCNFLGEHELVTEDIARKTFVCSECEKIFFDPKPRPVAEAVEHKNQT